MIVRIRFGVFYRIRLTDSSAIFSMFLRVFEVSHHCLTDSSNQFNLLCDAECYVALT